MWKPVDIVVALLAGTLGFALILNAIGDTWRGNEMNSDYERLLSGFIGAILAIVSLYVGAKVKRNGGD